MAKRLLPPDWHVTKDNGDPATDATLAFRLAGTATPTPIWYDKDLTLPTTAGTASVSCDSTGYPAASGADVAIWGADDVTYDVVVSATGYNGGASKTLEDIAVADASTAGETSSEMVLGNAFKNGGFDAWSGLTTFSNISGDGDGDEVADGWFFTQPAAASNGITQQAGFAIGAGAVEQRFSLRFGRPSSSTSTNELRLWQIVPPETAYRLRGKSVTLRFSAVAGANFSASGAGLGVRLATGTSESEDGDLIDAGGFAGHANAIDQTQAVTTTATRFEYTVTLGATIKEIGIQFSYTGVGTAGAADYVTIQDVELKETTASEEFASIPEVFEFLRSKLSTGGRLFAKTAFTDPGADRVLIWDESANDFVAATLGTGIVINGTAVELDPQLVDVAGLTPTDSNFIVGNGTDFVAESGATVRTSMGVGASDDVTLGSITTSKAGTPASFTNTTDAATNIGLVVQSDRATPANSDQVAIDLRLSDSAGNQDTFGRITAFVQTVTSGAEAAQMRFSLVESGVLTEELLLSQSALVPATNGGLSNGSTVFQWNGLFLLEGSAINWDNGDLTLTQTGNLLALAGGALQTQTAVSTETGSTLTAASSNKTVLLATAPTIDGNVHAANDDMRLYNNTASAMTITQGATGTPTQRLAGTATTGNLTLAARGMASVYFISATQWVVSGSVS